MSWPRSSCVAVFALVSLGILTSAYGAATDGMNCKTTGGFTYCEGKGTNYLDGEKTVSPQASDDGLMTRFKPQNSGGGYGGSGGDGGSGGYGGGYPNYGTGTSLFGYTPRSRCDGNRGARCEQVNVRTSPTLLMNARGEPRYILQLRWLPQTLDLAICTGSNCPYGRGQCDQQFMNIQLLSWDPDRSFRRLSLDTFRIPTCCKCQSRGGYFYFPRN